MDDISTQFPVVECPPREIHVKGQQPVYTLHTGFQNCPVETPRRLVEKRLGDKDENSFAFVLHGSYTTKLYSRRVWETTVVQGWQTSRPWWTPVTEVRDACRGEVEGTMCGAPGSSACRLRSLQGGSTRHLPAQNVTSFQLFC